MQYLNSEIAEDTKKNRQKKEKIDVYGNDNMET